LANDYGNLVQRLATLCKKNQVSLTDAPVLEFTPEYRELMDNFNFSGAIDYAWGQVQLINKHIEDQKPWTVAKTDPEAAKQILANLVNELLMVNHLLKPFLPITATIEQIFTASEITPPATPLFPKER